MKYKLWFCAQHIFSNTEKRALFEYFWDYERICKATKDEWLALDFIPKKKALKFLEMRDEDSIQDLYEYVKRENIGLVSFYDSEFPEKLKHIQSIPFQIFYKGRLPVENEPLVSIVGARMPSGYGKNKTLEISRLLGQNGFSVISGMARGIDSFAHEGAIEVNAPTFAVLGCGVDICYPKKNQYLYDKIIASGGVLSEYAPKVVPLPEFFPRRNRIISGLSDAVLLMEAKERSGSLITANFALEQGKTIFALPGRISDPLSFGTNAMISQGAGIIVSPNQLLSDLKDLLNYEYIPCVFSQKKKFNLEKEELLVYSCFDFNSKSIDEVVSETNLNIMRVLQIVLHLCDLGLIEETFMNQYIKV